MLSSRLTHRHSSQPLTALTALRGCGFCCAGITPRTRGASRLHKGPVVIYREALRSESDLAELAGSRVITGADFVCVYASRYSMMPRGAFLS